VEYVGAVIRREKCSSKAWHGSDVEYEESGLDEHFYISSKPYNLNKESVRDSVEVLSTKTAAVCVRGI
jgi:hypothetical protein